jgi:hypothetical protein
MDFIIPLYQLCIFDKKMGWATFWATCSQSRLVTLVIIFLYETVSKFTIKFVDFYYVGIDPESGKWIEIYLLLWGVNVMNIFFLFP